MWDRELLIIISAIYSEAAFANNKINWGCRKTVYNKEDGDQCQLGLIEVFSQKYSLQNMYRSN